MRAFSRNLPSKCKPDAWKALVHALAGGGTLGTVFNPKKNAIGFLRFFFAAMVVFSHSFPLGGFNTEPLWQFSHGREHFGTLGVICFFIVSGFLITRSQVSSRSIAEYLWHRFLRIMPGFWACLLVIVCFFAPLAYWLERGSLDGVVGLYGSPVQAYLKANWLLDIHLNTIGDLLQRNPFKGAIDGSLWTLGYEFRCYLCVAALGIFGCTRRWRSFTLLFAAAMYLVYALFGENPTLLAKILPRFVDIMILKLAVYFFAGSIMFLYREYIPINRFLGIAALIVTLCGLHYNVCHATGPIGISYLVLYAACRLPITAFDRQGDFSYGLYLYAFPIQQILALATINRAGFFPYFLCSLTLATGFGMISYFTVEKPALKLKAYKPSLPVRRWRKRQNWKLSSRSTSSSHASYTRQLSPVAS